MATHEVSEALDELAGNWREFRTAHEQKTGAIRSDVDRLQTLIDEHEIRLQKLADGGMPARTARTSGAGWMDVKAVVSGSGPGGGYLVPEAQANVFIDALRPSSVLLAAGATVIQTDAAVLNLPGATSDPVATWRGEGETLTSNDPVFRRVRATPRKLQSFTIVSNEALADSRPEIARIIEGQHAAQLALGLDRAAFDPHHQPVNAQAAPIPFAHIDGIDGVTTLGNDGSVPTNLDWLTAAIGKLLASNGRLDRAALFLSPRTFGTLLTLKKLSTGSNEPLLWSDRGLDGGPLLRLLGVPTFVSSVLPDDLTHGGSTGVCSTGWLIDMASVFIVVRQGTRIEVDRSRYFDSDQTAIRGTMRADVVLAHPELAIEIPGFKAS